MDRLTLSVCVTALLPLPALAQSITITPLLGRYLPVADQENSGSDRVWVEPGPAAGVKLAFERPRRIGFELTVVTTATQRITTSSPIPVLVGDITSASILPVLSTQRAVTYTESVVHTVVGLRMTARPRLGERVDLALGLGLSLTKLAGTAYERLREANSLSTNMSATLRPGASFGTALRVRLSGRTRAELGVSHTMYSFRFGRTFRISPSTGQKTLYMDESRAMQHDLVLSAGLGIALR